MSQLIYKLASPLIRVRRLPLEPKWKCITLHLLTLNIVDNKTCEYCFLEYNLTSQTETGNVNAAYY